MTAGRLCIKVTDTLLSTNHRRHLQTSGSPARERLTRSDLAAGLSATFDLLDGRHRTFKRPAQALYWHSRIESPVLRVPHTCSLMNWRHEKRGLIQCIDSVPSRQKKPTETHRARQRHTCTAGAATGSKYSKTVRHCGAHQKHAAACFTLGSVRHSVRVSANAIRLNARLGCEPGGA